MATGRTIILSDTHLGLPRHAALSADALRPLWQSCARVVLNGDVAEVHHPSYFSTAAEHVERLAELCNRDRVELTLLSGNHDPFITETRHVNLADGKIFVTHGDVMHPSISPWSPRASKMRERHEQTMAALPVEARNSLHARLTAAQQASKADFEHLEAGARHSPMLSTLVRPWAIVHVLWYWWRFPRLAAQFLAEHAPLARFGVLGHTHRPGVWHIGERIIINTGSYGFPGRPWAVVIEDDRTMSVLKIELRDQRYGLREEPVASFEL